jgi:hypothetical protein
MSARPARLVPVLALLVAACSASATPTAAPASPAVVRPSIALAEPTPAPTDAAPTARPLPTATPTPEPTHEPPVDPTPAPTAKPGTVPAGKTGRVQIDGEDVALTLPKGWRTLNLTKEDAQSFVDLIDDDVFPAGLKERLPELIAAGLKLFAWDTQKGDAGANLNVIQQPVDLPYAFLETAAQAALAQYPSVSGVTFHDIAVDGDPALRVDYRMTVQTILGKVKMTGIQVYVPRAGRLLILTVGAPVGRDAKDMERIVKGIDLLD